MISVAIDGPAGAGKSTIARAAARLLDYIYVDTGALYRTIGLFAMRENTDIDDENALQELLNGTNIELKFVDGVQHVFLNGEDVSDLIRTPKASMMASKVSAKPLVRSFLLDTQRDMAKKHNVIMDGRDIATVILPNANVKIFLTASPQARAQRRYNELLEKGENVSFSDVLNDIIQRDFQDENREIAPLKPAKDSILLDTSNDSLDEAIAKVVNTIKESLQL